jgi:predicted nucleotidyltransferase
MAKKVVEKKEKVQKDEKQTMLEEIQKRLPKDVQEKLEKLKPNLDSFKKAIISKFDKYIIGIALLPTPKRFPQDMDEKKVEEEKKKNNVLVLIDDSEPTKMSKGELKEKLSVIIEQSAKDIDSSFAPQTLLLSEIWQNCYDGKYELLPLIALSAPVFDNGMLSAIKIAELHKSMVIKKFEKYIVTYALAGSLVQGRATPISDIDVWIVIDDTDVKKMSRAELKDKLRAIIIGMGMEAGEITGIRNKINIQIYILTDFWDSLKEANPVIFTLLRDGVPFYDRGTFMPWKQLLRMGKIKPSTEAIDMYMSSGEQMLDRVKGKFKEMGTEDFFWSIFTPSQAALMLYGVPPPTPKELPDLLKEIFVKKEKMLSEEDVAVVEKILNYRKGFEHGNIKDISGKELDEMLESSQKYMKRLKLLFTQIERKKTQERIQELYEHLITALRDVLSQEGVKSVSEDKIASVFEKELIETGKIPAKFSRILEGILKGKTSFDKSSTSKLDAEKIRKEINELLKFLIEYMQRRRAKDLERSKLRIKYGEKIAEILLLGKKAFITMDVKAEEKEFKNAEISEDGSLGSLKKTKEEELEKALAKIAVPENIEFSNAFFKSLEKIFGSFEIFF